MKLFIIVILVLCILLARLNLPPSDNVNDFISEKSESNFLEKLSTTLLFSKNIGNYSA